MPGIPSGVYHSSDSQACGRTVRPRSASSSCKVEQAVLEPGALDLHVKVLEADLQELLVGQRGPGEFSCSSLCEPAYRCADGVTAGRPRQPPVPALAGNGPAPIFLAKARLL